MEGTNVVGEVVVPCAVVLSEVVNVVGAAVVVVTPADVVSSATVI